MSLAGLRDAIVTAIAAGESSFRTVRAHGGRVNREEIKRYAVAGPSALVTVTAVDGTRSEGGAASGDVLCSVFIVTRGTSDNPRTDDALALAESVVGLAVHNAWGYAHASGPRDVTGDNLYNGDIDKIGVALWAVSWKQQADLAIYDPSGLDDFETMHTDVDLPPRDGVINLDAFLQLQGAFMSAYGQLYVSSSVATAIAVAGTFQKLAGATTLGSVASDVDMPTDGRLRHTGTVQKPCLVKVSASITVSGDAKVTLAIAKGGTVIEATKVEEEMTSAGGAEVLSVEGLLELDQNEYVEAWVTADDTINVTATKLTLTVAAA